MWTVLASLISTEDEDIVVDSSLQPCKSTERTEFYSWSDKLFLDGFVEDLYLSFQICLGGGRLEVLKVPLPRSKLHITGYDPYPEEKKYLRRCSVYSRLDPIDKIHDTLILPNGVNINYAAHSYRDFNENLVFQIRIYMVSVKLQGEYIQQVIHKRGHKLGVFFDTGTLVGDVYLGRAQQIETQHEKDRTYRWLPSDEQTFGNLSPRRNLQVQAEESKDLILLQTCRRNQAEALISTRRIQHHADIVWDNDAYKNPNRRLPLTVKDLTIYIYNFKYIPPRHIQVHIRWGNFVTKYLQTLNKLQKAQLPRKHKLVLVQDEELVNSTIDVAIIPGSIDLWISFQMDKQQNVAIVNELRILVKDFDQVLDFTCV